MHAKFVIRRKERNKIQENQQQQQQLVSNRTGFVARKQTTKSNSDNENFHLQFIWSNKSCAIRLIRFCVPLMVSLLWISQCTGLEYKIVNPNDLFQYELVGCFWISIRSVGFIVICTQSNIVNEVSANVLNGLLFICLYVSLFSIKMNI